MLLLAAAGGARCRLAHELSVPWGAVDHVIFVGLPPLQLSWFFPVCRAPHKPPRTYVLGTCVPQTHGHELLLLLLSSQKKSVLENRSLCPRSSRRRNKKYGCHVRSSFDSFREEKSLKMRFCACAVQKCSGRQTKTKVFTCTRSVSCLGASATLTQNRRKATQDCSCFYTFFPRKMNLVAIIDLFVETAVEYCSEVPRNKVVLSTQTKIFERC